MEQLSPKKKTKKQNKTKQIDTCRDTIFNDPRMTLGSYVKGLNNMICREWVWKGMILDAGQWPGPDFMRAHTKVGLA